MKKNFLWYYFRSCIKPQSTFELLLNNEKYFGYGFIYILIPLIGYTLMYILLNANQHEIAMNSPTIWRTLLWTTFVIYFSAFMILFTKCVRTVHKLSMMPSIFIAPFSFITFQIVFLIFNR